MARRSLVASSDNATIDRRMTLPTLDNIDQWIVDETKKAEAVIWGQRDSNGDSTEFDTNTSAFDEFKFFQNEGLSEGAMQLTGCTMLIIISRRGVYLGHFWENISFATDDTHVFWKKYKEDQDKIFFETVIKGMRNGKGTGSRKEQDSLRLAASKFDDDHLKAYLIHPVSDWQQTGDYRKYWDQMKAEAITHLPKLGEQGRWEEHSYVPVEEGEEELLEETPRGRMLFKYDAKHPSIGPQIRPGGDPMTEHLAMLWSETRELHNDAWQADTIVKA
jgi:hypothetical protein